MDPFPSDPGRYGPTLDALPELAWVAGPDGTVEYMNRRARDYFGLPLDDLLGWDWRWVVHPADLAATLAGWGTAVLTSSPYAAEYRLRRHDGAYRWFAIRATSVWSVGRISRWFGTCTDIDDTKREQAELREARALFRALVERSDGGLALVEADGTIRYVNPAGASMLGYAPEQLAGTNVTTWVRAEDRAELPGRLGHLLASPGGWVFAVVSLAHRDGADRRVTARATNLLPDPGVRAVAVSFAVLPGAS